MAHRSQGVSVSASREHSFEILFLFVMALSFGLAMVGLGGMHILMAARNSTTIEYWRPPTFTKPTISGFSLGSATLNFEAVFGSSPIGWLFPVSRGCSGDGIHFPVVWAATDHAVVDLMAEGKSG